MVPPRITITKPTLTKSDPNTLSQEKQAHLIHPDLSPPESAIMCIVDSKYFHCEKCKQVRKIVVNEISTCTKCPERDYDHKQFECPDLIDNTLPAISGVCAICEPTHGVPWWNWRA
ncbi:hypothetical protein PG987_005989 [Apiospora arundinis]